MKITPLNIPDVLIIEPKLFKDDRGVFFESFNLEAFRDATKLNVEFVQENHSISNKNVLRGLHYQMPPYAQGKLVRVIQGEVFDVAVDIRKSSPFFGQHVSQILSAQNKKQMWIPEGFAHGFLTLSQTSEFLYKTTATYSAKDEGCIIWNDDFLKIPWPLNLPIKISSKDILGKPFREVRPFD
ncbi:dTDP-4-dehydrorhamnose 3,5-epimerase [Candidatus Methylopumilus planktonicus]|jgi:dTDP-4-dehydrorhamnose 3,5-epimerase|uniref:dTDP-4-dehydrorhamnose 3,5-epimerase n=1 Tax=Candidatus Methylopumilus planktonicus TaxID=1581557 RepID=UPI003BEEE480